MHSQNSTYINDYLNHLINVDLFCDLRCVMSNYFMKGVVRFTSLYYENGTIYTYVKKWDISCYTSGLTLDPAPCSMVGTEFINLILRLYYFTDVDKIKVDYSHSLWARFYDDK